MTEYHNVKVKLSDCQRYKFKSATKNVAGVTLRLPSDMIGADKNNFPLNSLLTNRQVATLCKSFADSLSKDIKLSKTQLPNVIQLGRFLARLLGPLWKLGLVKTLLTPLAKSLLVPLGLTAASTVDAGIHGKY